MAEISITVVNLDNQDQILNYELAPSTTISDLKAFVAAETNQPESDQILSRGGTPLTNASQTLAAAGIESGDMLTVQRRAPQQPPRPSQPTAPTNNGPDAEIETLRQRILQDPNLRAQFESQAPQLVPTINDPRAFREAFQRIDRERRAQAAAQQAQIAALNDDVNEENQAKIMEAIRMENIEREMGEAMALNPELFARVTMLYINVTVNGHPVKAFVDSGAQSTIMSPSCAEACGITRLIDTRWSGVARGVGTARILGRIHRATLKIGYDELPCSFTVMEGKDVDMLLGLDMLKRYQACIDLSKNQLVFPGGQSVPFLPEHEIPKSFEEALEQEPTVAGPGGTSIGATSGTIKPPPALSAGAAAGPSSSSSSTGAGNFRGAGQTLGSGSSAPPAAQTPSAPRSTGSRPAAQSFPQQDIDTLVGIGASREQAIQALTLAGGNVEIAAGLVFDV